MLNAQIIQLLVTGGVVGAVIGFLGGIPYLKKKGVNVDGAINTVNNIVEKADPIINVAKEVAPLNPVVNALDLIEKYAKTGVKNAQQLYDSSQLPNAEGRKSTAKETVYAALKEFNITPTENQQKLIDDTIEAAVNDLPHAPADVKQLQTTIDQQKTQVTQLQVENATLKSTINTITATATAVNTSQSVQPNMQQVAQ